MKRTQRSSRRAERPSKPVASDRPFELCWKMVRRVPIGRVTTYGWLSDAMDGRLTPVGVGWALRAAPPDKIPWQRVVNASGGISTDREHHGLQRALLEAEGVTFLPDGRVDLAVYGYRPRPRRGR